VVGRIAARLLRRHVGDGAERRAFIRELWLATEFRQPKIHDFDLARFREEDVRTLDVTVNDAFVMGRSESVRDGEPDRDCLDRLKRALRQFLLQCISLVIRHNDKRLALGSFIEIVYCADIGMVDRRGRLCLVEETDGVLSGRGEGRL